MRSPIYWNPFIYTVVMKILCGDGFECKYEYLKKEIGDRTVLDIGCGDCYLARYVKKENYFGLDINETFVLSAQRRGLKVKRFDLRSDSIPRADVIVLSNVLHQLYPRHEEILRRIIDSASQKVIVCEAAEHIASSKNRLVAWFARIMNDPGYGSPLKRLTKQELFELFRDHGVTSIEIIGRESIAIFEK